MEIKDLIMEKRQCKKCKHPYKVLKTSKQTYCNQLCEAMDSPSTDTRYKWGGESSREVRAPKAKEKR